jgi:hypothetical protein
MSLLSSWRGVVAVFFCLTLEIRIAASRGQTFWKNVAEKILREISFFVVPSSAQS